MTNYTADEIVYYLTKEPKKALIAPATKQQSAEISKARARLSRMAGSFIIDTITEGDRLRIRRA